MKSIKKFKVATASLVALLAGATLLSCARVSTPVALHETPSDLRIIGGSLVAPNDAIAQTTVVLYNRMQPTFCTASILSDSVLLTAAHCVSNATSGDLVVVFTTNLDQSGSPLRQVVAFKTSPLWPIRQTEPFDNGDIALIKFDGGLPNGYHPVELLTDSSLVKTDATVVLAGFGAANPPTHSGASVLAATPTSTADGGNSFRRDDGAGRLRQVETSIRDAHPSVTEILIEQSHGKGSCHGDSGGPAFLKIGGRLVQFGLTSRGTLDPNDTCRVAALYTNVSYYQNWIENTQAQWSKNK